VARIAGEIRSCDPDRDGRRFKGLVAERMEAQSRVEALEARRDDAAGELREARKAHGAAAQEVAKEHLAEATAAFAASREALFPFLLAEDVSIWERLDAHRAAGGALRDAMRAAGTPVHSRAGEDLFTRSGSPGDAIEAAKEDLALRRRSEEREAQALRQYERAASREEEAAEEEDAERAARRATVASSIATSASGWMSRTVKADDITTKEKN
jgi:hypothetical protein